MENHEFLLAICTHAPGTYLEFRVFMLEARKGVHWVNLEMQMIQLLKATMASTWWLACLTLISNIPNLKPTDVFKCALELSVLY